MEFITSIGHDCHNDVCSNWPRRDMLNEVILHLKSLPEVTYNKWVWRNNIYEKVILCESVVAVADQFDEIATKHFKLHVYNIFWYYSELKVRTKKSYKQWCNSVNFQETMTTNSFMKSKVLILDTRQLPYSLLHVMSKVLILIIISNIDKDTGLTVIPVVIVSNQTVHERNIAFSCNVLLTDFIKNHFPSV